MDRVTRNSASKSNALTNNDFNGYPSPGKLPRSGLVNASTMIGNRVRMALPAPPPIGVRASPLVTSTLLDDDCLDENSVGNAASQPLGESVTDKIEVECLPNGKVHLSLPSSISDYLLDNFISIQSQKIDLSRITGVSLTGCKKLTGASLQILGERLPALNNLDLTGCSQLNDNDLVHLAQMVNLNNLSLAGCHGISKAGLVWLSNLLDNVEVLDLTLCPQVDDEALGFLPNMHQLKHLILTACTNFSGHGLLELGKLKKLESLTLDQCPQISDTSLRNMNTASGFRRLTQINLSNCPLVSQHGVLALKQMLNKLRFVNTGR